MPIIKQGQTVHKIATEKNIIKDTKGRTGKQSPRDRKKAGDGKKYLKDNKTLVYT